MLAAFGSFPNRRPDSQEGLVAIPESFDFGSVGSAENRMTEFQLRNDSHSDSIRIDHVVPSCGCTVPKLVKDQLLPGERTTLKVLFRAPDERGPMLKTIRLDYQNWNDQSVHSLTFKLNAIIEPALSVTPPYLLLQPSSDSALSGRVEIKVTAGAGRDDGHGTAVRVVRVTGFHASRLERRRSGLDR